MSIELTKGERFNLSQEVPNFNKLAIALGWQVSQTAQNCDIDTSVFMLAADGRIPDEKYFVFYNNLTSPDGAVRHSGDSRNGQIEGDDETVYVDLSKINSAIQEIVFVVTLHEGQKKNQSFSQVTSAFIRLYNSETGSELVRYNLNQIFSQETALEFGRLYRKNGEWRFQAVGQGYNAGLQSFVDKYYVENAVTQGANAGEKVDDAEVLRRFSDRVDKLLREESVSKEVVEQPVANAVNADLVQSEEEAKIDDSALENLEAVISAEDFLQRYEEGERDFTGVNLAGVNLSGKSLSQVNLSRANLSGAELSEANLHNANLSEANLCHANLHKANLNSANLRKTKLLKANVSEVSLYYANLSEANLSGVNLSDVNLYPETNLSMANLSQANLTGLNLSKLELMKADLSNANLTKTNLFEANLKGANLEGAKLQRAVYNARTTFPTGFNPVQAGAYLIDPNASLQKANLAGFDLSKVNLTGANLQGANLTSTNLNGAILSEANLSEANLSGANLEKANLQSANLLQANLSKTNLSGANLMSANLTATNLTEANLMQAILHYANLTVADLSGANLKNAQTYGVNFSHANLEKANMKGANMSGENLETAKLTGAIMPDGTIHE